MTSIITAALLMCTSGDPVIADRIATEAARQDTNIVVALTIGILESGLGRNSHDNPMGVRGCYPKVKKKKKRTANDCIRIGVTSIHNRLWDAHGSLPSKQEMRACAESGSMAMCRALIVYSGANRGRKFVYAKKAMGIIRAIYRTLGSAVPTT